MQQRRRPTAKRRQMPHTSGPRATRSSHGASYKTRVKNRSNSGFVTTRSLWMLCKIYTIKRHDNQAESIEQNMQRVVSLENAQKSICQKMQKTPSGKNRVECPDSIESETGRISDGQWANQTNEKDCKTSEWCKETKRFRIYEHFKICHKCKLMEKKRTWSVKIVLLANLKIRYLSNSLIQISNATRAGIYLDNGWLLNLTFLWKERSAERKDELSLVQLRSQIGSKLQKQGPSCFLFCYWWLIYPQALQVFWRRSCVPNCCLS